MGTLKNVDLKLSGPDPDSSEQSYIVNPTRLCGPEPEYKDIYTYIWFGTTLVYTRHTLHVSEM